MDDSASGGKIRQQEAKGWVLRAIAESDGDEPGLIMQVRRVNHSGMQVRLNHPGRCVVVEKICLS